MKKYLLILFALCVVPAMVFSRDHKSDSIRVGSYYADAWNGVSMIVGDEAAFLMKIGWVDPNEKSHREDPDNRFYNFDGIYAQGDIYRYKNYWNNEALPEYAQSRPLFVGNAAPDGSFTSIGWNVDAGRVMLEWSKVDKGYIARVSSDTKIRLTIEMAPSWETFDSEYRIVDGGIEGKGIINNDDDIPFRLSTDKKQDFSICIDQDLRGEGEWRNNIKDLYEIASKLVVNNTPHVDRKGNLAVMVYDLLPGEFIHISAGIDKLISTSDVDKKLKEAKESYLKTRTWAEGDWGDFVSPISRNLAQSRLYNYKTGDIAYTVSRGWSNYDGVVLFKWDTFFNSLMGNIEDPETAKNTIRAILKAQQPNGIIPNFTGPHWGTSKNRPQPQVVGMCVWKIYQRWPDKAFLREIFDDIVSDHDWWMSERPENGLPYTDGNRDGLISCTEESGDPFAATYVNGMDNSPQWAETTHTRLLTRSFRHDQVDLSALWISDGQFLALIADEIGEHATANRLRKESDKMAEAMNNKLWSEDEGMYTNRFWDLESIMPALPVPRECLFTENGKSGLVGEYYSGIDFNHHNFTRNDLMVDFLWKYMFPVESSNDSFSVRWTGKLIPEENGKYIFGAKSSKGVRIWIDGKLLIDDWKGDKEPKWVSPYGIQNKAATEPIILEAGKEYDIKIEYCHYNNSKEACMIFRWYRCSDDGDGLFSKRIGATNLYPLIGNVPDEKRAERVLAYLQNSQKLWGQYVVPTTSRDDPYFNQDEYWKGRIWGPTNYLAYQGIKNYASDKLRVEYARKSVALFMKNWIGRGVCSENYHVSGLAANDPHYTWGALLCMIGLEEICDIEPDGRIRLNGTIDANIFIHNLPLGGKYYDVRVSNKKTELIENNKVVMSAINSVKHQSLNVK